jgi:type IV secretory pathway TraG/TraD family ATPase VirD4
MGGGGSAGFASIVEEWANRWRPGLIFLGHSMHDRHWPVGVDDDRMMVLLAGTGGGKNLTSIINNMLSYEGGSMFCMDVKGQNAAVTAQARRDRGQDVYILAPFAEETAHLNPLDGCDPQAPDYFEQIMGIVDDLVIPSDGKNQVWTEWSRIFIGGLTDYELRRNDGEFVPPEEEYGNDQ